MPCKNNGKCISLNETNSYVCACKKIFTGKHCEKDKETAEKTIRSFGRNEIAVIAVAPTGKASFVYSYVQTKLMGQANGKRPFSHVYVLKPLKTAIRAIDDGENASESVISRFYNHISLWSLDIWLAKCIVIFLEINFVIRKNK